LIEYTCDPNSEFARFSMKTIWKLAIKFPDQFKLVIQAIFTILFNASGNNQTQHLINEAVYGLEQIYLQH